MFLVWWRVKASRFTTLSLLILPVKMEFFVPIVPKVVTGGHLIVGVHNFRVFTIKHKAPRGTVVMIWCLVNKIELN